MSKTTPATLALDAAGIAYALASYDYDPGADRVGLQAAEAMGVSPRIVYKTLMALVDGKPVCAVVPSDEEVNMKKLAAAAGGKAAQMMKPIDAERQTGYRVGGISPFGQKRQVTTIIEETSILEEEIFLNGGQRGLQVRLKPDAAIRTLSAIQADLIR
ncbi:Cys-tRNA(Pro) deacylase [Devosia rhodophyticola]|uniref:Cys-tRNA(Pro)/Cys-tRNA(Cys) deacylase n=1 Tax=Devosia rhodophyticola TaxID=3026423 RepID=A0ABY7YYL8_9HYPH|nr:Cys-tRNA(Pro) deacylase [Devosia rhodophyticola]WDR06456.1 Cys-tRNA(Pro) deacylase [Devosia rhodophyticola]